MTSDALPKREPAHAAPAADDFISLREIVVLILRHRLAIAIAVAVVTAAAAAFFLTRPRAYEAEGYVQVMPAPTMSQGRVDRDALETSVLSHLQRITSAFIAQQVSDKLQKSGKAISPETLSRNLKVTRPAKTDLIHLVAVADSKTLALEIVRQWIQQYFTGIQINNLHTALAQVRFLLSQEQTKYIEKQAALESVRARVAATAPLLTLSRAVDDRQLWKDLAEKDPQDSEAMRKLANIHIKGQEQSSEYVNMKLALDNAERELASVGAKRTLLMEVERILEAKISNNGVQSPAPANAAPTEAEIYINSILKYREVIEFGEPGLISSRRGALTNTLLAFLAASAAMCFWAFLYEWGKGMLTER